MQRLHDEFANRGVQFLAVNFGDSPETIRAYFEKERFTFTPVRQDGDDVSSAFGVQSYPTNYVLGPDGRVAWRAVAFDEAALRVALGKIAPQNGSSRGE